MRARQGAMRLQNKHSLRLESRHDAQRRSRTHARTRPSFRRFRPLGTEVACPESHGKLVGSLPQRTNGRFHNLNPARSFNAFSP